MALRTNQEPKVIEMSDDNCPFCNVDSSRIVWSVPSRGIIIRDAYPVQQGHLLVIPPKHVASLRDLGGGERDDLFFLVEKARHFVMSMLSPDGVNIGINDGVAAGQTVMHLHVHVIPRWCGDVENPRGGVRNVIPGKGDY